MSPGPPLLERSVCQALVITCSDFRFKSAERALLEASGLNDDYDLIARPGAGRSLVAPRSPAAGDTMWDEVRLLWSLHRFRRILLVNHVSCRAYDDLATAENEREVHTDHLRRAAAALDGRLADLAVETFLADVERGRIVVRPT